MIVKTFLLMFYIQGRSLEGKYLWYQLKHCRHKVISWSLRPHSRAGCMS